jgi:hypothetical protein
MIASCEAADQSEAQGEAFASLGVTTLQGDSSPEKSIGKGFPCASVKILCSAPVKFTSKHSLADMRSHRDTEIDFSGTGLEGDRDHWYSTARVTSFPASRLRLSNLINHYLRRRASAPLNFDVSAAC